MTAAQKYSPASQNIKLKMNLLLERNHVSDDYY